MLGDERGVSAVVSALIICGLITFLIATIWYRVTPLEQRELEAKLSEETRESFRKLKEAVEGLEPGESFVVELNLTPEHVTGVAGAGQRSVGASVNVMQARYVVRLSPVEDTYVDENVPDTAFGAEEDLQVRATENFLKRTFFKFDLGGGTWLSFDVKDFIESEKADDNLASFCLKARFEDEGEERVVRFDRLQTRLRFSYPAAPGAADHVVISEVLPETPGPPDLPDFIELYNPTSQTVSLGGWVLESETFSVTFTAADSIPAYGFFLVSQDSAPYGTPADLLDASVELDRQDGVRLLDPAAETVDAAGWSSTAGGPSEGYYEGTWFTWSGSGGNSLERKAQATSTASSMEPGGSDENSGNAYDTNNNSEDFVEVGFPRPQNSENESEAPAGTVILDPLPPTDNAVVYEGEPDTTHENENLAVRSWTDNDIRTFLQFDLANVPEGFDNALLELYLYDEQNLPMELELYRVEDDTWDESTLTWNNMPALGSRIGILEVWWTYSVPGDAQVERATLWVYKEDQDTYWTRYAGRTPRYGHTIPMDLELWALDGDNWSEDELTWNALQNDPGGWNARMDTVDGYESNTSTSWEYQWFGWDVTEFTRGQFENGDNLVSFVLKGVTENSSLERGCSFTASEEDYFTFARPYLEVVYTRGDRTGYASKYKLESGRIEVELFPSRFPRQRYIFEGGGVILWQWWRETMLYEPRLLELSWRGDDVELTVNRYRISSKHVLGGTGAVSIRVSAVRERYLIQAGDVPNKSLVSLTVITPYLDAWREYLSDFARRNNLAFCDYEYADFIETDWDRVSITIDADSDDADDAGIGQIFYSERVVDLEVVLY